MDLTKPSLLQEDLKDFAKLDLAKSTLRNLKKQSTKNERKNQTKASPRKQREFKLVVICTSSRALLTPSLTQHGSGAMARTLPGLALVLGFGSASVIWNWMAALSGLWFLTGDAGTVPALPLGGRCGHRKVNKKTPQRQINNTP